MSIFKSKKQTDSLRIVIASAIEKMGGVTNQTGDYLLALCPCHTFAFILITGEQGLTKSQRDDIKKYEELGYRIYVVYDFDDAEFVIEKMKSRVIRIQASFAEKSRRINERIRESEYGND